MRAWLPVALAALAAAVLVDVPRLAPQRLDVLRGVAGTDQPTRVAAWAAIPVLGLLLAGPAAALLAIVAVVAVRRARRARQGVAEQRGERSAALDALSLLAADLSAGRPPADALGAAARVATGPTGAAFAAAAASAALGGDTAAAFVSDHSAVPGVLRALAACWQVCSESGSGLSAAVERLEQGLRASEAQRRAVDGELAGPRATAALLAVLPLGGIALSAALGAHPLHVLLHTPLGLLCLLVGVAFDAAGVAWTRRLVARAAPP